MNTPPPKQINSSTILLGFVAILAGLAGTYTVRMAFAKGPVEVAAPAPAPKPPARKTIPLASRDIPAGTEITLDDIALYRLTAAEIEELIDAKSFMANPTQIIGKIAQTEIKRGKTFDTRNLLPPGRVPGVTNRLKSGLRAVTIVMSPTNALLGFAGPGNHVDVLFHFGSGGEESGVSAATDAAAGFKPGHHNFNPPHQNRDYYGNAVGTGTIGFDGDLDSREMQNATSTLVQNAEVLAIGTVSTPSELSRPLIGEELVKVTLAVEPRQAEMLRVATGHGELSLTLRSPDDTQKVSLLDPITLSHLIAIESSVREMEIFRGQNKSKVQFGSRHSIRRRTFEYPPTHSKPREPKQFVGHSPEEQESDVEVSE